MGVRLNLPEVPADVLAVLPPVREPVSSPDVEFLASLRLAGPDPRPGVREYHLVYADHVQVARTLHRPEALALLEQAFQTFLSTHARDRVFVHAGVVAHRGKALLVPGRSMAGKSTLVKALLAAGATYYSDEYAVLDAEGRVHPYPRPLSIRTPNGTERPSAADLGAATGTDPLPVGLVVQATYRPGADWRPQKLSPARGLLELATYTQPEVSRTPAGQEVLGRLATTVPVYKGPRGDAAATARELLRSLETSP